MTALPVPERAGGDGVGLPEIATALTEIGRHGLISPALATLGFGAIPLLDLASDEQQDRYLAGLAKGSVLTAALNEPGAALPDRPATTFVHSRLSGTKVGVGYAEDAERLLVTADSAVVVVSPKADGVQISKTPTSNGSDEYAVTFSDVAVGEDDVLIGATAQRVNQLALAAIGSYAAGLVAGALRLTADYVAHREQFGKPLSTFQTVAAQLAEVYIASRTIDLASTSVIWRLAERAATPQADLDVLGYWITSQAPPVMQICHHLHGGMGMDITYPMHRYYSTIKDLTRLLGGPSHRLDLVERNVHRPDSRAASAASRTAAILLEPDLVRRDEGDGEGPAQRGIPRGDPADGPGRQARRRMAKRVRRLGLRSDRAVDLRQRGASGRRAAARGDTADGRSGAAAVRHELQKKKFLPAILAGEVHFAIGYTEPEAGTDLASLRTTAVRHGDEYIVNGQKIFTTGAHDADYIWLACRTDPEAVKHKGISILIVDTKDPGYSWTPIILSDGAHHTNATYYNDVRVPADMLVGEENGGWRLITTQLNNERVMLGPAGRTAGIYDRLHEWASKPGGDGVTPIDHQDVKRALGEIYSMWRVNELLNWQVAAAGEDINVADAASTKVFGTESIQYIGRLAEEIVGKYGNPADRLPRSCWTGSTRRPSAIW